MGAGLPVEIPRMRFAFRVHRLAVAVLAAALALAAAGAQARTVMVFGDSLSAAYNLPVDKGWVHLVEQKIRDAKLGWNVVNASVSGETTAGGLRRLPEDLKRHHPDIVVIELGANDALRGQPVAGIRSNLVEMIKLARKARAEPVIVGLMIPPNYGIDYAAEFQRLYPALARAEKAPLVPFLLEGIADKPEMFQADQLHPTAEGEVRVAENVWATLKPVLAARR
ncbi:MAG TPA: arylesterase [Usitatibacter sp.]|nr:arylesterase [Usitatibacter sp.]